MTLAPGSTEPAPGDLMRSIIQRIATGPTQSKDISREEAHLAMRQVLDGSADPVQAAVFLVALRMKRETDDEYRGVLDALRETTATATSAVERLVDVADPYDGFDRSLPASTFLPALLAACGVPALVHGLDTVGPKHGLTHRQVLSAAGVAVDLSPAEAAGWIADPAIGWSYCDQARFNPRLHALGGLRELIVKRPCVTTAEQITGPVRAAGATHLLTGYVHKAYPRIYALLARHAGFDSALLVRGVEGGVVPSLRQPARVWRCDADGEEVESTVDPTALGIDCALRAPARPEGAGPGEAARAAAAAGVAALGGAPGPTREALVYGASLSLWHLGDHPDPASAAAAARAALDSGAAAERLQRAVAATSR